MRRTTMARIGVTALAMAVALGACGGTEHPRSNPPPRPPARPTVLRNDPAARAAAGKWVTEWAKDSAGGAAGSMSRDAVAAGGYAMTDAGSKSVGVPTRPLGGGLEVAPAPTPTNTALNAGSVDDNATWEKYLQYREHALAKGIVVHDVDVQTREVVHVVDRAGKPVLGAHVELRRGDAVLATRTSYADGRVLFFPPKPTGQDSAPKYTLSVTYAGAHADQPLDPETHDHTVTLDASAAIVGPVPLDIMFLVDATGSMGDEIEQLKANMVLVADKINKLSPRPDVRFGMTIFRDRGDEFITRTFDFTADVNAFTTALRAVVANGGGDTPESVNQGLHDALAVPHWRGDDTIKLVFLVGDAAPHLDYAHDADYAKEMQIAAERGIKIDPLASSGLDDQGEFIFRQLAQYTTGRFCFLTYGADGHSPGVSTPHHVDDYSVLSLDQLVVKLVEDEIGALNGPAQ